MSDRLDEMHTFVRVVEAGSITLAADQLNTVKSAISRKLVQLESQLGVSLLTRTTRKQTLTEAGERYYHQCLRILDDIHHVESSLHSDTIAMTGRIKLAAPLSFGLSQLTPAITAFTQHYPDIHIDINFDDRRVNLIEEGYDVAIRIAHLSDSSLVARRIHQVKLILCASPNYLLTHHELNHPSDLLYGHNKLHYHGANEHWQFTDSDGSIININIDSNMTANNGDFLCQAAIEGFGLVYLPDFICQPAIESGKLTPVLASYMPMNTLNCYAVYPQNRYLSPRVKTFIDYLNDYFATI
jgi:DNA-binding transcriptional LysR family regulator